MSRKSSTSERLPKIDMEADTCMRIARLVTDASEEPIISTSDAKSQPNKSPSDKKRFISSATKLDKRDDESSIFSFTDDEPQRIGNMQSLYAKLKDEIDIDALEMKIRGLDRKEVPLDSQLYDPRCNYETGEILKRIESYIGSHTLVINDSFFMKSVWEKIKEKQREKDEKAAAKRRFKAVQFDRYVEKFLPPITSKQSSKSPCKGRLKMKSTDSDIGLMQSVKKADIEGKAWYSSLKKKDDVLIAFTKHELNISFPKSWARVETMYRKAEKMVNAAVVDETCPKPLWLKHKQKAEGASFELKESTHLPKIDQRSPNR